MFSADEINRATPKTQSALLEAMQERAVTVAGERRALSPPFLVLATQNPIEMEGTYPLPEAQLGPFLFKIRLEPPDENALVAIVESTTGPSSEGPQALVDGPRILPMQDLARPVPVADPLVRHVARIVRATDPSGGEPSPTARKYLRYGAGVRGAQALVLAAKVGALMDGRAHVSFDDIRRASRPALRHRLIRNFEGEAEGIGPDAIIEKVLSEIPELPSPLRASVRAAANAFRGFRGAVRTPREEVRRRACACMGCPGAREVQARLMPSYTSVGDLRKQGGT